MSTSVARSAIVGEASVLGLRPSPQNLASMLALLSYPPLVEPNLPTHTQGVVWSAGYVCFALLCALLAWSGRRWRVAPEMVAAEDAPVELRPDALGHGGEPPSAGSAP